MSKGINRLNPFFSHNIDLLTIDISNLDKFRAGDL